MGVKTGIYAIIQIVTGRTYVGQAVDIARRWRDHRAALRAQRHRNAYLQRTWDKYGLECFAFVVVEECGIEQLTEREQFWLDRFRESSPSFNFGQCADAPRRGVPLTEEHRARIGTAHLGKTRGPLSAEHRAKIKANHGTKGRKLPPLSTEHRANLSAALKGKQSSLGRKLSEETRAKIGAAHRGKKGTPHSAETRAKLRALHLGRKRGPQSAEHKAKISAAMIAVWAAAPERKFGLGEWT
jgi:group I intron endonuclease